MACFKLLRVCIRLHLSALGICIGFLECHSSRRLQLRQQLVHLVAHRLHKRREIPREMRKIKGTACAGTSILLWTLSLSRALRLFVASGLQMSTQCLAPVCTTSCEMWFSLSNSSWAAVSDTMSLTGEPLDDLWDDD